MLQTRLLSGKLYNYYHEATPHTICGGSIFYDLIRADNCVMVFSHDIVQGQLLTGQACELANSF